MSGSTKREAQQNYSIRRVSEQGKTKKTCQVQLRKEKLKSRLPF